MYLSLQNDFSIDLSIRVIYWLSLADHSGLPAVRRLDVLFRNGKVGFQLSYGEATDMMMPMT